jgi:hypothetical protein
MITLWLAIWHGAVVVPTRESYPIGATNGGTVAPSLRSGVLAGAERGGVLAGNGIRGGTLGNSARGGQVIEG